MKLRNLIWPLIALAMVAAACGDDDDTPAAPAATAAPSGAPTPNNGEQFVVAWTPYTDPTNDLNVVFDNEVKAAIENAGMKHVYCSGKGEAVGQANCIDQFIAQDVDIILLYPGGCRRYGREDQGCEHGQHTGCFVLRRHPGRGRGSSLHV